MDDTEIQPLTKTPNMVASLEIIDNAGKSVSGNFKLHSGANEFSCRATYIDGSSSVFAAYWTCPIILNNGGADFYGVLGPDKRTNVTINASINHTRYTELACWVKFPDGPQTDANEFPHASIGFDYSEIENINA